MSKGQVRLMTSPTCPLIKTTCLGASGHHFCVTGQVDFAIMLVDSVRNFPQEIIIIIIITIIIIIIVTSLIYLLFFKYWLVLFQRELLKNIFRVICCEGEKTKFLISEKLQSLKPNKII